MGTAPGALLSCPTERRTGRYRPPQPLHHHTHHPWAAAVQSGHAMHHADLSSCTLQARTGHQKTHRSCGTCWEVLAPVPGLAFGAKITENSFVDVFTSGLC